MMDRVLRPKKSILMRPVSSMTLPSYCVTSSFSPVSLSSAMLMGTWSVMSSRQMIVPQACTPVLRTLPSSIFAYFMVSRNNGSGDASASRSSGTAEIAFGRFIFIPSGKRSGIALQSLFDMSRGTFCTRATSFMASFVAIVPYVMICATFSCPYFSVTQFRTRPRPSSSKSTSISGSEMRSGLRKRSNSKSYFIGSTRVIPSAYATTLPAAEPRPGPTDTPNSSRAARMKSCTIRK